MGGGRRTRLTRGGRGSHGHAGAADASALSASGGRLKVEDGVEEENGPKPPTYDYRRLLRKTSQRRRLVQQV